MKVFNTVLNVILLIAVIVLFSKVYSNNDPEDKTSNAPQTKESFNDEDFKNVKIAYIATDSLVEKYDYHRELREKLEARAKRLEADLAAKSRAFEENYTTLQKQAESMDPEQLQAAQMDLQQTQQELLRYRDERANELAQEEQELNALIMKDMEDVLNEIKSDYGIDYVLSYDPNSILLSANTDYNITALVAQKLNEKHQAKSESKSSGK